MLAVTSCEEMGSALFERSRFAYPELDYTAENSHQENCFTEEKTAPRIFLREDLETHQESLPQTSGTHQENTVFFGTIVLGCAVAPNNAGSVTGPVYGRNGASPLVENGDPIALEPFNVSASHVHYIGGIEGSEYAIMDDGSLLQTRGPQGMQDMTPMWFGIASTIAAPARLALPAAGRATGGQLVKIAAHGMRHFPEVVRETVSAAIKQDLATLGTVAPGQIIQRTITVGGEQITYRGMGLVDGTVNVGTAFPGAAVRNIALPKGGG